MALSSQPLILQWDENLDVGADTGKLDRLTLAIQRPKLTPEDEKRLMAAQRNDKTSE